MKKTRQILTGTVSLLAIAAAQGVLANCVGTYCTFNYGGLFDAYCDADCTTYVENLVVDPIVGSPVLHTELILTLRRVNCNTTPSVVDMSYSYTQSESISHSGTGTLTNDVTGKVGQKDVWEVGLSHAVQNSTTKIFTDSWSQTFNVTYKPTLGPCSAQKLKLFGKYKTGTYSGSGHVDYTLYARHCFWAPGTVTGSCAHTTSNVSYSSRHYTQISAVNSTEAASPAECQNGCKPKAEVIDVNTAPG